MQEVYVPDSFHNIVKKEIPNSLRLHLLKGVHNGYELVSKIVDETPMFNNEIGQYHIGYLKHIAVQYTLQRQIFNEDLQFETTIEYNQKGKYPYLVIHNEDCEITVSQTSGSNQIARPAYFRTKRQQANQLKWNLFHEGETSPQGNYFLLTHGYQTKKPSFVNLGMPNEFGWIDKVNLQEQPILIENDREKEEVITEENLVGFRDYLRGVDNGAK